MADLSLILISSENFGEFYFIYNLYLKENPVDFQTKNE